MTEGRVKRKLSAILSADVKGYSRLMGLDEAATVQTLKAYRKTMFTLIREYSGRVVDSPGDNLLAEFESVIDAVQCAVEIQQDLKAKNVELSKDRRMEFRIGVNLGDVIKEGERIYGDGVNIAARIEGLAEGGGICISGTVYDQVENKLDLGYEDMGEQVVKNIAKPIRVYKVPVETNAAVRAQGEVADKHKNEFELSDKASIAVLPFVNLSGDSEQEYFSDGMTEDLITDLSKISGLFVIARNSVFTYKGKSVKVEDVGQELGVQYVLEGSVRKVKDRVRITAQLVDAATGGHVWAERYDRDLADIFDLQDEVAQKIVDALEIRLTKGEQETLGRTPTHNLEAYDCFLKGGAYFMRTTKEANAQARSMYQKAIDLDPKYADAYTALGISCWAEWIFQWTQDPETLTRANELMQKAIALDESSPNAHVTLGFIHSLKGQYEQASEAVQRAIALDPNNADGYLFLGHVLILSGRAEEAIPLIEKAMRLNPHYPFIYMFRLGQAYHLTGQHEEAILELKKVLNENPDFLPAHIFLAVIYSEVGHEEEARTEVAEIKRISPDFSCEAIEERFHFHKQDVMKRVIKALRKAGLE